MRYQKWGGRFKKILKKSAVDYWLTSAFTIEISEISIMFRGAFYESG